ncbi:hypothetical protein [Micromonospora sp. NPDC005113]
MGWFTGGDKHTGWKQGGPNGKPVTDKQAKQISASIGKNASKKK